MLFMNISIFFIITLLNLSLTKPKNSDMAFFAMPLVIEGSI